MDHEGGAAGVEQRIRAIAERDIRNGEGDVANSFRIDFEIRQIAGVRAAWIAAAMLLGARIEVRTGAGEIGARARTHIVDVNRMRSGR